MSKRVRHRYAFISDGQAPVFVEPYHPVIYVNGGDSIANSYVAFGVSNELYCLGDDQYWHSFFFDEADVRRRESGDYEGR